MKFTAHLNDAVIQVFDENSEHYVGNIKDEDLTDFFYALMCTVPNRIYNKITGEDLDMLDSIATANKLVVNKLNQDHKKELEKLNTSVTDKKDVK